MWTRPVCASKIVIVYLHRPALVPLFYSHSPWVLPIALPKGLHRLLPLNCQEGPPIWLWWRCRYLPLNLLSVVNTTGFIAQHSSSVTFSPLVLAFHFSAVIKQLGSRRVGWDIEILHQKFCFGFSVHRFSVTFFPLTLVFPPPVDLVFFYSAAIKEEKWVSSSCVQKSPCPEASSTWGWASWWHTLLATRHSWRSRGAPLVTYYSTSAASKACQQLAYWDAWHY